MIVQRNQAALVVFAVAIALGGCSQNSAPAGAANALGPGRVAVVNGTPIAESVLRVYSLASTRKNLDDLSAEERGRLIDDLIGVELLRQQAEKEGLTSSRTVAAQLELQRLQLVGRAMATSYLEKNRPTEAVLQQLYDENLPRLTEQQYKARHILVATREEALRVIEQLRGGKDFVALAQELTKDPAGEDESDLGWFTATSMQEPAIAEAVRAMQVGAYSEPVETQFGFHVLLLEDTRQQQAPAMADIRAELQAAAERKQLDDYMKSLRMGASVEVGP